MQDTQKQKDEEEILRVIPHRIRYPLISAIAPKIHIIQEIVLRAERPVCIYIGSKQMYLTKSGCITENLNSQPLVAATTQDVIECFNTICGYSVYAHLNEIKEGFVTLRGGHRAGVTGTAVVTSGEILNIRDISTVSLRIAREVIGCADEIVQDLVRDGGGLLICGSPSSGKTTVLKDIARQLSSDYACRVSLVDTRGELAGMCKGISGNDVGMCDVLDGYPRDVGIEQAVRTLSPQYVVCDEIGTFKEASAIENGINSGVNFVATIHAATLKELREKKSFKALLQSNAFSNIIFLSGRDTPGKVMKKYTRSEIEDV